jgi:predicted dinucleotide-binding enzyme
VQAVGHELLLQLGEVVADLVGEQVVVGVFEADAAHLQHIGHRGFQLGPQVEGGHLFAHAAGGLGLEALAVGGLEALHHLAQLQQLVVERRGRQGGVRWSTITARPRRLAWMPSPTPSTM